MAWSSVVLFTYRATLNANFKSAEAACAGVAVTIVMAEAVHTVAAVAAVPRSMVRRLTGEGSFELPVDSSVIILQLSHCIDIEN